MGLLSVEPASALDMLETVDDDAGRAHWRRKSFAKMARQVAASAAVTIRDQQGRLVLVAGLWPEAGYLEAWFAAGPALRANLRGGLRRLGRALAVATADQGPVEVRAFIHPDSVAGARIAAWLGLSPIGEERSPIGALSVFSKRFTP